MLAEKQFWTLNTFPMCVLHGFAVRCHITCLRIITGILVTFRRPGHSLPESLTMTYQKPAITRHFDSLTHRGQEGPGMAMPEAKMIRAGA